MFWRPAVWIKWKTGAQDWEPNIRTSVWACGWWSVITARDEHSWSDDGEQLFLDCKTKRAKGGNHQAPYCFTGGVRGQPSTALVTKASIPDFWKTKTNSRRKESIKMTQGICYKNSVSLRELLWKIKHESLATIFQGISHAEKTNWHIFKTWEYDDEQR